MASDPKVHLFEEVSKHSQREDCWLIINGKVYDVTPFMDEHPGGDEVLLASTKKDATTDFEDTGHSDDAKQLMKKYCIGVIDATTVPQKRYIPPPKPVYSDSNAITTKILQFLMPILILALALAVRHYTKEK